ncbi:MAG: CPBP family intramembrane glutamic endopeptidase [Flavisolibacter sp.]
MQTYLKTRPIWIQLLLFIGMAFGLFFIVSLIGIAILSKMTHINLLQLQDMNNWDPNNPDMIYFIRGMLLLQFIGLFLIPSLLFAYFSDPKPLNYIGLHKPDKLIFIPLAVILMFVAIPLVEYTGILNQQMTFGATAQKWMKSMEEDAAKQIQFMLHKHTSTELILNLIFISVFAGIGEELFFRGILQRLMIRACRNPLAGIIITAIIFSGFHLQFFGFIPRMLLGILLGLIYWYSGSIWAAILAHFAYDGLIVVIAYIKPSIVQNPESTMFNPNTIILPALISGLLIFLIIRQMKVLSTATYSKVYKNDTPSSDEDFTF